MEIRTPAYDPRQARYDIFSDAVTWVARVLPSRPASPILGGILLEAGSDHGTVTVSGFDYEVSALATVEAEIISSGSVVVSGRLFAEIIRGLPPEAVQARLDGTSLELTCGGYRYTLPALPVGDYPALPDAPPPAGTIDAGVFTEAVSQVALATSRDETVPMLTGVWLEIDGETITMAGTDRYRMALRSFPWHPDTGHSPDHLPANALIPARVLAEAAKTLPATAEVTVGLTGTMIGLTAGGRHTTMRLLDERFIDFRKHFPAESTAAAEVPATAMAEAVKRVALVADQATPVWVAFGEKEVILESGAGEDMSARAVLDASLEGADIRVAFKPKFLLDGLAALDGEVARFHFTAPTRPVVIGRQPGAERAAGDDFRYLVQPLRTPGHG